jgi:hypothetical protein
MRLAGHVVRIRKINAYTVLVEKPEGKRPLRRPRHRWKDKLIKTCVTNMWCEFIDCTQLAHDKVQWRVLVNMIINLRCAQAACNFFHHRLSPCQAGLCFMALIKLATRGHAVQMNNYLRRHGTDLRLRHHWVDVNTWRRSASVSCWVARSFGSAEISTVVWLLGEVLCPGRPK